MYGEITTAAAAVVSDDLTWILFTHTAQLCLYCCTAVPEIRRCCWSLCTPALLTVTININAFGCWWCSAVSCSTLRACWLRNWCKTAHNTRHKTNTKLLVHVNQDCSAALPQEDGRELVFIPGTWYICLEIRKWSVRKNIPIASEVVSLCVLLIVQ